MSVFLYTPIQMAREYQPCFLWVLRNIRVQMLLCRCKTLLAAASGIYYTRILAERSTMNVVNLQQRR
jgi:hypothetical protein